jgi:predicted  nucleic acid-binding Zn-ribbon protein
MPHRCVHCGRLYEVASKELLEGCSCGSHFFLFLKPEQIEQLKQGNEIIEMSVVDKKKIEEEVREMIGVEEEETPVILDLESVKVLGPGKFEIDIVNLFSKSRPLIYKLEEGKYIIDIASTLRVDRKEIDKKIKNPEKD